jgi:hypothetical protein
MDKIVRETMKLDLRRGERRMINLETFIKSLKLTWIAHQKTRHA